MNDSEEAVSTEEHYDDEQDLTKLPAHPVGTLAIVLIFAALFALGWLGLYFGIFVPRGMPSLGG